MPPIYHQLNSPSACKKLLLIFRHIHEKKGHLGLGGITGDQDQLFQLQFHHWIYYMSIHTIITLRIVTHVNKLSQHTIKPTIRLVWPARQINLCIYAVWSFFADPMCLLQPPGYPKRDKKNPGWMNWLIFAGNTCLVGFVVHWLNYEKWAFRKAKNTLMEAKIEDLVLLSLFRKRNVR